MAQVNTVTRDTGQSKLMYWHLYLVFDHRRHNQHCRVNIYLNYELNRFIKTTLLVE